MGEGLMVRRIRKEIEKAKQNPKDIAKYFTDKGFTLCVDAYMTHEEIQAHLDEWWKMFGQARFEKNEKERK